MLFTLFASTNQLPGFCKGGTLPAPNMRNTERWLLSLIQIGKRQRNNSLSIPLEASENIFVCLNLHSIKSVNLEVTPYTRNKI